MNTRLAGLLLATCLFPASVAAYDTLQRGEGGTTALDIMEMFVGHQGAITDTFVEELFDARVMASMNVPTEHLRVAFYDAETGRRMDRHEIREIIGDEPHDGMVELMFMAEEFVPGSLPMEVSQLVALMDASFLASMRVPAPVDVEFYDARCGPKGQRGGGVSGYTPREPCVPGADGEPRSGETASRERPVAEEPDEATGTWAGLNMTLVERLPLNRMPRDEAGFEERLATFDFDEPAAGLEALPVHMVGRSSAELEADMEEMVASFEARGYELVDMSEVIKELYGDEVLAAYFEIHARRP